MEGVKKILWKYKKALVWIFLWLYYSSFAVIVYYDSAHYLGLVRILEGDFPITDWDIVRGPIFPYIIYLSRKLFGANIMALTIITFISFAIMLVVINKIISFISNNIESEKIRLFFKLICLAVIVFNPILFGYYHALLTEFVALTVTIGMCYLSWKWIKYDYFHNKKQYIISTLVFGLFTALSWNLKQPYVVITLFPLLIACLISLFQNFNISNLVQKIITLSFCIICLVSSITMWNTFLTSKGLDLNTDRNAVQNLGGQVLEGSKNLVKLKDFQFYSLDLESDPFFNDEERDIILDKNKEFLKDFYVVNVNNPSENLIVDRKVIDFSDKGYLSLFESLSFVFDTFLEHPYEIAEGYLAGYFMLVDLYGTDPMTSGLVREYSLINPYENGTIGAGIAVNKNNVYDMPDFLRENTEGYQSFNKPCFLFRLPLRALTVVFIPLFTICMLILPFMCLVIVVIRFVKRKQLSLRDKDEYNLIIILLGFSFLNALVYVATNATIDRYIAVGIIPITLSYLTIGKRTVQYLKHKNSAV